MVANGQIPKQRIDESFKRIMLLKSTLTREESIASYQAELMRMQQALDKTQAELKQANEELTIAKKEAAEGKKSKKKKKKS
jgi:hypothetical protein